MREILFRGKRTDNGEWIYGDLMQNVDCIKIREQEKDVKHIAKSFEIDLETVGQYTDLTDKNGKRIFEGDIIKRFWLGAEIIYCVRYDGENAHFIGEGLNKSGFTTFDGDGEMFEVIGNIHDKPEFLKGGEG